MKIIDGKKISNDVLDEIKIVVDERIKNRKKVPHLAAVLVGDDGPSETGKRFCNNGLCLIFKPTK